MWNSAHWLKLSWLLSALGIVIVCELTGHAGQPDIPELRNGSRGIHVEFLQKLLRIDEDGIFGSKTERAVRAFQHRNRLVVDGVVGKNTWQALRGSGEFRYAQSSGEISRNGVVWAAGYSGFGNAKNAPSREKEKSKGPIPRGKWKIGQPRNSTATGPIVLDLKPHGHNAHQRTAFQIHGDSKAKPGEASRGCIILPRHIREHIAASGEKDLEVIE